MKTPEYRILVVDDQIAKQGSFRDSFLEKSGRRPEDFVFCTGQDANGRNRVELVLEQVRALWVANADPRLSLILLDIRFDDGRDEEGGKRFGFKLLRDLREQFGRALPIVMLTTVSDARGEANAAEADGFLPKGELTPEVLAAQFFRNGVYPETTAGVLGVAPAFLLTLREVRRGVVGGVREFLLLGESGTGKSELAQYVHRVSKRTGRIEKWFGRRANAELHYDQLFGHWRGAHDGAREHRAGAAEKAHMGTLFLDEVAELAPETQTDFLEYRQRGQDGLRRIRRLGNTPDAAKRGTTAGLDLFGVYSPHEDRILVDTVLISATNRPIDDENWRREAGFRPDLFNRLGHRLGLPPLRERAEDIVPLFTELACAAGDRRIALAPDARQALESHAWREGNIAELKGVAETVVAKLGSDFDEVHARHFEGLLRGYGSEEDQGSGSGKPPNPPIPAFVGIELRSLWGLAELLRTAVVETRRPTGLGSLADILKQATGVEYAPTDVKREVKKILEAWFAPNERQIARWQKHPLYTQQANGIRNDTLLSCLYKYSCGKITWDAARAEIVKDLEK